MAKPVVSIDNLGEDFKETFAIPIITEYTVPGISSCCYVVDCSKIFDT